MSKPFMCGDEVAVYVPDGGCECNYTLQRVDDPEYAYAYKLLLNGTQVGDLITVPKDKYVSSCTLNTAESAGYPYADAQVGDMYLDISFDNYPEHIYVSLAALMGGGYTIVDSLPDEGDPRYIYLVDDGHGNYDRYVWDIENNEWVNIGGTSIDLSDYYTKSEVDSLISNIMLRFYPIGSIYTSVNSTDPGTLFGGTWARIEDRFLLAAGSTYTAGTTGGAATHTLTVAQMPSHTHTQNPHRHLWNHKLSSDSGSQRAYVTTTNRQAFEPYTEYATATNQNTGGGQAHNNMPPYLVIYVWKRTA